MSLVGYRQFDCNQNGMRQQPFSQICSKVTGAVSYKTDGSGSTFGQAIVDTTMVEDCHEIRNIVDVCSDYELVFGIVHSKQGN